MEIQKILIIGANSGIAKALAKKVYNGDEQQLILVSRNLTDYQDFDNARVEKIQVDNYSPETIENTVKRIENIEAHRITDVFICHGILHTAQVKPEKRLEDFSLSAFEQIMQVNALLPLLWIKALTPHLTHKKECKIIVFSARVGSISDNALGGWYSYRASKAALNMMLKTAAIELARRAKNIKLISFHPGTTDTKLSKPFQNNVPKEKLFTCEFAAKQLLSTVEKTQVDGKLSYLDWQGKTIPW